MSIEALKKQIANCKKTIQALKTALGIFTKVNRFAPTTELEQISLLAVKEYYTFEKEVSNKLQQSTAIINVENLLVALDKELVTASSLTPTLEELTKLATNLTAALNLILNPNNDPTLPRKISQRTISLKNLVSQLSVSEKPTEPPVLSFDPQGYLPNFSYNADFDISTVSSDTESEAKNLEEDLKPWQPSDTVIVKFPEDEASSEKDGSWNASGTIVFVEPSQPEEGDETSTEKNSNVVIQAPDHELDSDDSDLVPWDTSDMDTMVIAEPSQPEASSEEGDLDSNLGSWNASGTIVINSFSPSVSSSDLKMEKPKQEEESSKTNNTSPADVFSAIQNFISTFDQNNKPTGVQKIKQAIQDSLEGEDAKLPPDIQATQIIQAIQAIVAKRQTGWVFFKSLFVRHDDTKRFYEELQKIDLTKETSLKNFTNFVENYKPTKATTSVIQTRLVL